MALGETMVFRFESDAIFDERAAHALQRRGSRDGNTTESQNHAALKSSYPPLVTQSNFTVELSLHFLDCTRLGARMPWRNARTASRSIQR